MDTRSATWVYNRYIDESKPTPVRATGQCELPGACPTIRLGHLGGDGGTDLAEHGAEGAGQRRHRGHRRNGHHSYHQCVFHQILTLCVLPQSLKNVFIVSLPFPIHLKFGLSRPKAHSAIAPTGNRGGAGPSPAGRLPHTGLGTATVTFEPILVNTVLRYWSARAWQPPPRRQPSLPSTHIPPGPGPVCPAISVCRMFSSFRSFPI